MSTPQQVHDEQATQGVLRAVANAAPRFLDRSGDLMVTVTTVLDEVGEALSAAVLQLLALDASADGGVKPVASTSDTSPYRYPHTEEALVAIRRELGSGRLFWQTVTHPNERLGTRVAVPVRYNDTCCGFIYIAFAEEVEPSGDATDALHLLGHTIGTVLGQAGYWPEAADRAPHLLAQVARRTGQTLQEVSEPLFVLDAEQNIVLVSGAFARVLGQTQTSYVGRNVWDLLVPGVDRRRQLASLLQQDGCMDQHLDVPHASGETVRKRCILETVRDAQNQPLGHLGFLLSETANGTPLAGPSRLLQAHQALVTQLHDRVLAADAGGIIREVSADALTFLGFERPEDLVGESLNVLVCDRNPAWREALEDHASWSGLVTLCSADGVLETLVRVATVPGSSQTEGLVLVLNPANQDDHNRRTIQHRLRVEAALVKASRMLLATRTVDFEALLRVIGDAVGTESAYLLTLPQTEEPIQDLTQEPDRMEVFLWHRDGQKHDQWVQTLLSGDNGDSVSHLLSLTDDTTTDGETPDVLAVPVLSKDYMLYGYLGFEYGAQPPPSEWVDEDFRVLTLMGDLLATYFERGRAEAALRLSEERYRSFVSTITEGVWRIAFDKPVPVDLPYEQQNEQVLTSGYLAECNRVMADFFGDAVTGGHSLIGRQIKDLLPVFRDMILNQFVDQDYTLTNFEYVVPDGAGEERVFMLNAVGTVEESMLTGIWGSCIEVTERVQLERRMVAALEDQQQRIGRDLHDGVGQLLTGIRMLTSNMAERTFEPGDREYEQAQKVVRFATQASQRVREIYRGLTPAQLFHEGLSAALEELVYNTNALPDVACELRYDSTADVYEREAKLHLYRITQEAINNALKHARAERIIVTFKQRPSGDILLRVQDDGVGFDPSTRKGGGSLGLDSMTYRARSLRATLRIDSEPGSGTVIECVLPGQAAGLQAAS